MPEPKQTAINASAISSFFTVPYTLSNLLRRDHGLIAMEAAVGHTRLGTIPKTRKWRDVVEQVVSGNLGTAREASFVADMPVIAAKTLDAAQRSLEKAVEDPGVRYTFYLLTQVALAARTADWQTALSKHGIRLSREGSVFDLTVEVQAAIDRHVARSSSGPSDLSEIAQQSAGEAILSLAATRTPSLFGGGSEDAQQAIRSVSTKKGFGELGQQFFGKFVSRFLNFYLSRITAAELGKRRLKDLGDVAQFNEALRSHCIQSARIVRDFCGTWYSKTEYKQGIDLENSSRFLAVAMKKLRSEPEQQEAEQ
jgi:hypothetical protein